MALTRREFLAAIAAVPLVSRLGFAEGGLAEAEIKAAIVLNLARFTDWPPGTFPVAASPLRVCLLGDDPVTQALAGLAGETVKGHPVETQRLEALTALDGCHVAYVAAPERKRAAEVIAAIRGKPVLSVADIEGFATWGGAVSFWHMGGRVRIDVNRAALRRGGLELSSKVLRLARLVEELR
ncbi:YfiR family protein [Deferrisoma palaeochoriense]